MDLLEQIKCNLREHKAILEKKFSIKEIGIFGSYVKGDYNSESDLDILVEFNDTPGLLSFIRLKKYLSQIAGVKVDLVMKRVLKPYIGQNILQEVIYL